jgi:hypothetical protein
MERLERRIRAHQEEVARLRKQLGDPQVALFQFVMERFEVQALVPDDERGHGMRSVAWEDDDELNVW